MWRLQVKGLPAYVFAAGDCTDTPEEKTAFAAELAATLAAKNIIRLAAEQPLLRYPQDLLGGLESVPVLAGVSLYKHTGIMVMNKDVQVGFVPGIMKGFAAFLIVGTVRGKGWASATYAKTQESMIAMATKSAKQ
jgi:NADH dehydrogenase FAD-containing subunit